MPCHRLARALACLLLGAAAAKAAEPLSLDEAVRLAEARSARLAAQSAAVDAAGGLVGRAGQLPDPKLRFGIDNLPVSSDEAWSLNQDSMTMKRIGVVQDLVNGDKRRARTERAVRERDVEQAGLALERTSLRRDAALAWYEVEHAIHVLEVMQDLVNAAALQEATVGAAIAAGRAPVAEGFTARSALETTRDRVLDRERMLARARIALATLIGHEAERPIGTAPDASRLELPIAALLDSLERQPALQVLERREALARSEVALAQSAKRPDWGVELSYGQRSPNYSNMLTLMFSVDLPVFAADRQDRDVAASLAQVERARAQREEVRRTYAAQVRSLAVDWETWNRRVQRGEQVLVPLARGRAEAALAAYRGGRGDLASVIDARKSEADTQLGLHEALLERGRAWAGLRYLAPDEGVAK